MLASGERDACTPSDHTNALGFFVPRDMRFVVHPFSRVWNQLILRGALGFGFTATLFDIDSRQRALQKLSAGAVRKALTWSS